jgi:hypothetical protein
MFKARFFINCVPTGLDAVQMDEDEMTVEGELPFVPHGGMRLSVTNEGDYLKVEEVYWKADEPEVLEVFFESDRTRDRKYFAKQGWKQLR